MIKGGGIIVSTIKKLTKKYIYLAALSNLRFFTKRNAIHISSNQLKNIDYLNLPIFYAIWHFL